VLLVALAPTSAAAAGPFFFQGFEKDTSGWCDDPVFPCEGVKEGTITRVPSGYKNGGGYADGIPSAAGKYHARLRTPSDPGCKPGLPASQCEGPYSELGLKNDATFPAPGYLTQLDVYLDTPFAATHHDYRFDLESAINNNTTGTYLQGFDFNAGTTLVTATTPGFVIGFSTNADRSGAFPENPCPNPVDPPNTCRTPVTITTSGWYRFRHTFSSDATSGRLTVRLQILKSSGVTVPGADWTITSLNKVSGIGADVGGPSLLWFPNQEINDLAIDNTLLRGLPPGCPPGDNDDNNGGGDNDENDAQGTPSMLALSGFSQLLLQSVNSDECDNDQNDQNGDQDQNGNQNGGGSDGD
jgi:hypothetical protein